MVTQYVGLIKDIDNKITDKSILKINPIPVNEVNLLKFYNESIFYPENRRAHIKKVINIYALNENEYNINNYFKHNKLRCEYNELPIYDTFIFLFTFIYCKNVNNRTIKYEKNHFYIHLGNGEWEKIESTTKDLLSRVFDKIHEFLKIHDFKLPKKLLNEYQVKYCLDDGSDYDEDDTEEDRMIIDTEHSSKYKLMMKYAITDYSFDSMSKYKYEY